MESLNEPSRRYYVSSLVNLVLPLESSLQVSFRIEVVWVNAWYKIELSRFEIGFDCFLIIESRSASIIFLLKIVAYLRSDTIEESFCLRVRVKSELWPYLFVPYSLSHSPVQMLGLCRFVVNCRVVLFRLVQSFQVRSKRPKMHHTRSLVQTSILWSLLKHRYEPVGACYWVFSHLNSFKTVKLAHLFQKLCNSAFVVVDHLILLL